MIRVGNRSDNVSYSGRQSMIEVRDLRTNKCQHADFSRIICIWLNTRSRISHSCERESGNISFFFFFFLNNPYCKLCNINESFSVEIFTRLFCQRDVE